ncbi:MAG: hypothetical protein QMD12_00200 [Candidatus Aenigmarchaeota archaeon]|nr:hypothetical protein [Candidatus Aenigmarchaeota archaeon]
MEIEIKEEKDNPFLGRKELRLELKHDRAATPSKQQLIKELASRYSVPEERVLIDFIFTKKGVSESIAKVKICKEPKIKEKKEVKSEAQTSEAE